MKTYKVLLITILTFAVLIGGLFALQTMASVVTVKASAAPFRFNLENPAPPVVKIKLTMSKPYMGADVNGSTILVGGLLPEKAMYNISDKHYMFLVDGPTLLDSVILPKVWHMVPPPKTWVEVEDITVTGMFYDGTPFEGTFTAYVKTEGAYPPPPPP